MRDRNGGLYRRALESPMQSDVCAFCRPRAPAAILFETASLLVMPDEFPLLPGHTLIIPKQHLRCYAAGTLALWQELDDATARVRRFLADAYDLPVASNETGATGQTVFHAHLHVTPLNLGTLPPEIAARPDVQAIDGWPGIATRYRERGEYYYVEVGGQRDLFPSIDSPALQALRTAIAEVTGLTGNGQRFERGATAEDAAELRRRWQFWANDGN
jgi:diadenosine tetraphosphate (Ap4A) HIT family hydrolase